MASSIITQNSGGNIETSAATSSASSLHNTHLQHLSSLSQQYTTSYPHHHLPQQQYPQQFPAQHQQQQPQHWDYYGRQQQQAQPPPNHAQQQPTQSNSTSTANTTAGSSQSRTPPTNSSNSNSNSNDPVTSQSNSSYTRPWEMETKETAGSHAAASKLGNTVVSAAVGGGGFEPFSKLPSFQSQFHSFNDQLMPDGTPIPPTAAIPPPSMAALQTVAMSPASISVSSPGMVSLGSPLTQLSGSLQSSITPPSGSFAALGAPPPPNAFHHPLSAASASVPRAPYPLVPAPLQPSTMVGSYATSGTDHLQLYQPLTPSYAAPTSMQHASGSLSTFAGSISNNTKKDTNQTVTATTTSSFDLNNGGSNNVTSASTAIPLGMQTPTPSYDGSTQSSMMDTTSNGAGSNGNYHTPHSTQNNNSSRSSTGGAHTPHTTTQIHTPTPSTTTPIKVEKVLNSPIARVDARKKERRKNRANSLESSAESEASAMEVDPSNPGQVDAVSSTANFKSPISNLGMGDSNDANGDKQVSFKIK